MADIVLRMAPEIIIGLDTINRMGTLCSKGRKVMLTTEQGLYENSLIERLISVLDDAGI